MSNLWEKVKFIYADANQSDGYVECDIDKKLYSYLTNRYTKPTDKQLNDIKIVILVNKLNALRQLKRFVITTK